MRKTRLYNAAGEIVASIQAMSPEDQESVNMYDMMQDYVPWEVFTCLGHDGEEKLYDFIADKAFGARYGIEETELFPYDIDYVIHEVVRQGVSDGLTDDQIKALFCTFPAVIGNDFQQMTIDDVHRRRGIIHRLEIIKSAPAPRRKGWKK